MSRDIIEFFVAFVLAIAVLIPLKKCIDSDWDNRRNAFYGDVEVHKPKSLGFLAYAKNTGNKFLEEVAYEVLTPFNGHQDQVALEICLKHALGGWFEVRV